MVQEIALQSELADEELTEEMIATARAHEFDQLDDVEVLVAAPRATANGQRTMTTKWVGRRQVSAPAHGCRSRLAARDFNSERRLDVFAATPSTLAQ